jgi:hypothetical protein
LPSFSADHPLRGLIEKVNSMKGSMTRKRCCSWNACPRRQEQEVSCQLQDMMGNMTRLPMDIVIAVARSYTWDDIALRDFLK